MRKQRAAGNNPRGMTLVEVILAMAILAIVVLLMAPVLVSAFNQIVLIGQRLVVVKGVAGAMDEVIAGSDPVVGGDVQIELPGGIAVDGKKFTLASDAEIGTVDLDGYQIDSMPFITATTPDAGPTPTATPTPTPEPTPTPDPLATPTPTPDPLATPTPTTAPTPTPEPTPEPAFEMVGITVDVSDWRTNNRSGLLILPDSLSSKIGKLEYQIVYDKDPGNVYRNWSNLASLTTYINLDSNTSNYSVIVRQRTNIGNSIAVYVRQAPVGYYTYTKNNKVGFKINIGGTIRAVLTSDHVQQRSDITNNTWSLVVTDYEANNNQIDEANVYLRFAASLEADGVTIQDPASFPARVIGVIS